MENQGISLARDCPRKFRVRQPDTTSGCSWSKPCWKRWINSKWFRSWKPSCCSAGAGTTSRPTSELDTGSLETFSQRRMNITGRFADSFRCLPVLMEREKKTLAQARHHRDWPACAKFTWLATGGETGDWWVVALHTYIYQCRLIFRQADDVTYIWTYGFQCGTMLLHTYFFSAAWFSDRLFPEPLRGMVMFLFPCNALVLTLHVQLDQCSPIFRRTWIAEPEPLRGGVLWIYSYGGNAAATSNFLKIGKCFDGITCVRNGGRLHSTALNHGYFGFCRCSLIFSWSRLGEILLFAAWLWRVLCQQQVVFKFLFQRAAFLIVATVGWCPLNVALRVTRQAWLQRWWHSNIFNHVLHCCHLEHATIKYLCLTWCIGDLPATHRRITWVFLLLFTWGHSTLGARGNTLTRLLNSAELYGFWQICILQFRSATCLVKPLTNELPKQTFTYSAAFGFISKW